MKEEIFKNIADLIAANNKELSVEAIKMESSFEDLNIDSLDGITIISDLERNYNIILSNEEVANIKTVRQAVEVMEKHLSEK
jgi:acyl carrier protein